MNYWGLCLVNLQWKGYNEDGPKRSSGSGTWIKKYMNIFLGSPLTNLVIYSLNLWFSPLGDSKLIFSYSCWVVVLHILIKIKSTPRFFFFNKNNNNSNVFHSYSMRNVFQLLIYLHWTCLDLTVWKPGCLSNCRNGERSLCQILSRA